MRPENSKNAYEPFRSIVRAEIVQQTVLEQGSAVSPFCRASTAFVRSKKAVAGGMDKMRGRNPRDVLPPSVKCRASICS